MKRIFKVFCFPAILFALILALLPANREAKAAGSQSGDIVYKTHVENIGWMGEVKNGDLGGTEGRSLRMEGVRISVKNAEYSGDVEYCAHVQNIGWMNYVKDGQLAGTTGKSLRIEAIRVRLTGELAGHYDIYYQVHAQNIGWMGWAKNDEKAGTAGKSLRLEAIRIKLVPKGEAAPGSTDNSFVQPGVLYNSHVQNIGWIGDKADGDIGGTEGRGLRLEALRVSLYDKSLGGVTYRAHVQNIGWQGWVSDGALSGTEGRSLRLEAVSIKLTGEAAKNYDIYYRTHIQDFGWTGWAKNGEDCGSQGYSKRLEAVEIKLVGKNKAAPGSEENIFHKYTDPFSAHGSLSVAGTNLVDSHGAKYQLHGVSTHGISWFPQYVNQGAFQSLRDNWNVNAVRIAMYPEEYNGYLTGGNRAELEAVIDKGVNAAKNLGMYVIIDWHIVNTCPNPQTHQTEAVDFFRRMSAKYSQYGNVLYEICNEPNSGTNWNQIASYANAVIPVIHANDNDAVIIVGTPTWSQDVDSVDMNSLTDKKNVMFALHFYAATHKDNIRQKARNAISRGIPVFISEFSICDASGNGSIDYQSAAEWKSLIKDYNLSFMGWSLCNKNETSAIIKQYVTKTDGFTESDLTDSGRWLLDTCKEFGQGGR